MSRIFEAIQRADWERNGTQQLGAEYSDEATIAKPIEECPQAREDLDLGRITRHPWRPFENALPALANRGSGIEQFRTLRSRIDQLRIQSPIKTILVSSGLPAEGKTFVAANLALSLARNTTSNVLLIDGDLRRGTLHNLLGAPNSPGLAQYLDGTAELTSILQRNLEPDEVNAGVVRGIPITFISAGTFSDHSSELVASYRMEELVAILSPHFDWIIIDSPPVLAVTDAVELARVADGIVLVARGASTSYKIAQRTVAALDNSRILGFVLNAVKGGPRNQSYSYYYGDEEGKRQ